MSKVSSIMGYETLSFFSHCIVGAVVEYRIINYSADEITIIQIGKLESIRIGEICE